MVLLAATVDAARDTEIPTASCRDNNFNPGDVEFPASLVGSGGTEDLHSQVSEGRGWDIRSQINDGWGEEKGDGERRREQMRRGR